MRRVPLIRKHEVVGAALVDDADFAEVRRYRWRLIKQQHTSYARATIDGRHVYLHRFLLPAADEVDHVNHDGLDNRRANLRAATHQQNALNRSARGAWKGVSRRSPECWSATIELDRLQFHLRNFSTPEQAARAYDEIAWVAWGTWAKLNFPDRVEEYERQCRECCYYPDGSPGGACRLQVQTEITT